MRKVLVTLVLGIALFSGPAAIASAAPTTSYTTVTVPSPYPWEAPLTIGVSGAAVREQINQGPVVSKLAIDAAPPTTDPIYSQSWRLLSFGVHTEIQWRNTATGASGTAVSDKALRWPAGGALIDTGTGSIEYSVVMTIGAFVPQINPHTITVSGAVQVGG